MQNVSGNQSFFSFFHGFYKIYPFRRTDCQNQLKGITNTIAGSISAIGNFFKFRMRKPVATINNPPQALKSAIIPAFTNGRIHREHRNKIRNITNCGMAIREVTSPRLQAKIVAVNRSRMDLEMRMLLSPVIPASRQP